MFNDESVQKLEGKKLNIDEEDPECKISLGSVAHNYSLVLINYEEFHKVLWRHILHTAYEGLS